MHPVLHKPAIRRYRLYGLVLLAVVLLSMVVVVLVTEPPLLTGDDVFPSSVLVDPQKRPDFIFPESVRTYDISLNRFVDRFARICMQARYDDFRLMLSTRNDPIVARRFESIFNAIKQVRIQSIERLPDIPDIEGPVYILTAQYDLEDYVIGKTEKTDTVKLAIAREEGRWRIGPVPRDAIQRLQIYRATLDAKAAGETGRQQPATTQDAPSPVPQAAANRPVRVDS